MTLLEPELVRDEGSVVVLSGTQEGTTNRWLFAVDWREASHILADEAFAVEVESWQLLGPARG